MAPNNYLDTAPVYFIAAFQGATPEGFAAAAQVPNAVWQLSAADANGNATALANLGAGVISTDGTAVQFTPMSGAVGSVTATFNLTQFGGSVLADTITISTPVVVTPPPVAATLTDSATAPAGVTFPAPVGS
jgi:hypothetical protein